MDFDNILSIASQNQGLSSVQQKRYSLQTGPPKKDPKAKGVNSTAVQAFLKKKASEDRHKELLMKKEKEVLTAKRVELKSDRKARAMASRTKDNFRGYNGIPVVDEPKKRRSKGENVEEVRMVNCYDPTDEDNYEYEQTDSESEEAEPQRPPRRDGGSSGSGVKASAKKPSGQAKPPPPPLNFAELLKLAEKRQFEPVEVKAKPVKKEGRLRTAEEIREIELERKAKRLDKGPRDSQPERDRESKSQPSSSASRKSAPEKEQRNGKPAKSSSEKSAVSNASGKKSKSLSTDTRDHSSSSKPSFKERDRDRPKSSQSDRDRPKSRPSGALTNPPRGTPSQVKPTPRSTPGHKSSTQSDLSSKKVNSALPQGRPGPNPTSRAPGQRPQTSGQPRPGQGTSLKGAAPSGDSKVRKGEPVRPGANSMGNASGGVTRPSSGGPSRPGGNPPPRPGGNPPPRPGGNPPPRPGGNPPPRPGGNPPPRPGGVPQGGRTGGVPQGVRTEGGSQARPGGSGLQGPSQAAGRPGNALGRPGTAGQAPGRPSLNPGLGPGRPKCTVVSETISVSGARPGVPPRPGGPPRPGVQQRPGMPAARPVAVPYGSVRPEAPTLPPITSSYKRKYVVEEDDEYDSEMEDFIDEGDGEQEEVSKHIREIFGYDRSKYKEESDYALQSMESSYTDMQKEEARSLRLAVEEDMEEERREEEDIKRHAKRKKM